MLYLEATTENMTTMGECDRIPPRIYCRKSVLCYLNQLHDLESNTLAKKVFCDLVEIGKQGFNIWPTVALKLVYGRRLDVTNGKNAITVIYKRTIQNKFITTWKYIHNILSYIYF